MLTEREPFQIPNRERGITVERSVAEKLRRTVDREMTWTVF